MLSLSQSLSFWSHLGALLSEQPILSPQPPSCRPAVIIETNSQLRLLMIYFKVSVFFSFATNNIPVIVDERKLFYGNLEMVDIYFHQINVHLDGKKSNSKAI